MIVLILVSILAAFAANVLYAADPCDGASVVYLIYNDPDIHPIGTACISIRYAPGIFPRKRERY
ncbi:hypothetical protein DRQ36_04615 [bacterium]|nr:MAG: hypothetical protein DRQ36_04615 [bacterium]